MSNHLSKEESEEESEDGKRIASHLIQSKEIILANWEALVRGILPDATTQSESTLRDSLPKFLSCLAESVAAMGNAITPKEAYYYGDKHGEQRASCSDYSISEILSEYQVLTEVILKCVDELVPGASRQREFIIMFVQAGMCQAASTFVARQKEIEGKFRADALVVQSRLQAILDNTRSVIVIKDTAGRVILVNKRYEEIFGRKEFEVIGKTDSDLFEEEHAKAFRDNDFQVIREKMPVEFEEHAMHVGDGIHTYISTKAPIFDENGEVEFICGVSTDITEIKRAAILKEQFVNTLSHDLRNPLSASKMAAQLILMDPEKANKKDYASRIIFNLTRADKMISDLLDVNGIRSGNAPHLELENFSMNDEILEVVNDLKTIHGERFKVKYQGNMNGRWSKSAVHRVVENLLSNAIKYGSPTLPVTVSVTGLENTVQISVHNEGRPILSTDQHQLFDPFFRSDEAKKSGKQGWGLGLTLVKGLTEAHGGRLAVKSSEKEGTTFTIHLPQFCEQIN